jgi:hypothetical protein
MGSITLKAQEPDFKFHLAFEDATGAKDTVWMVWDSLATMGYDTIFNEYPHSLPTDTFQVYIKYSGVDSGKVRAYPFNVSATGFNIEAQNYVYPISMYWDTSLIFHNNLPFTINSAQLDNEWFFFNGNHPNDPQIYSMIYEDSIELPTFNWGSQEHFPMVFSFGYDPFLDTYIKENFDSKLLLYPNPTSSQLVIRIKEPSFYKVNIINIEGKQVVEQQLNSTHNVVNVNHLPNGIYHYKIIAPNKELLTGKISIIK